MDAPLLDQTSGLARSGAVVRHYTPEPALRHPWRLVVEISRDLAASRELAWQLFVRDLKANYRQSILGYVWAFLPPLAWGGMFIVLHRQGIMRTGVAPEIAGGNYAAFVLTGMVLWQVFVDALQMPLRTFGQARGLLAKLSFPREALLLAGAGEVAFQFLLRTPLLVWAWWAANASAGGTLVWFPLGVVVLAVAGACLGVLLLPLGLLFQDVGRGLALVTSFWLLLTPVAYAPPTIGWGATLAQWNPVSPLITTVRGWWLGADAIAVGFPIVAVAAIVLLALGWIVLRVALPHAVARFGS